MDSAAPLASTADPLLKAGDWRGALTVVERAGADLADRDGTISEALVEGFNETFSMLEAGRWNEARAIAVELGQWIPFDNDVDRPRLEFAEQWAAELEAIALADESKLTQAWTALRHGFAGHRHPWPKVDGSIDAVVVPLALRLIEEARLGELGNLIDEVDRTLKPMGVDDWSPRIAAVLRDQAEVAFTSTRYAQALTILALSARLGANAYAAPSLRELAVIQAVDWLSVLDPRTQQPQFRAILGRLEPSTSDAYLRQRVGEEIRDVRDGLVHFAGDDSDPLWRGDRAEARFARALDALRSNSYSLTLSR